MIDSIGVWPLVVLWAAVAFGAVVPIVPTGAVVSGAAVIAGHEQAWEVVLVVAVGALGAWCGDVVVYRGLSTAGVPLAQRLGWLPRDLDDGAPDGLLQSLRERIERHEVRTLLISRLVPGGRVPVLLVAALTGYPWQRFVSAAVAAALLWSTAYAAVGVLGSAVVPDDRIALVVTMVVALLVTLVVRGVQSVARRLRPSAR